MQRGGRHRHNVSTEGIKRGLEAGRTKPAAAEKYAISVVTIDRRLKEGQK